MKTPKFTLFLTALATLALIGQDVLLHNGLKWLELLQNSTLVALGGFCGMVLEKLKDKNKKPPLIDSEKLSQEVIQDEKKQLQEKIKTLEAALDKLIK